MSMPDGAGDDPRTDPEPSAATAGAAEPVEETGASVAADPHELQVARVEQKVELERTVRFGRILIVAGLIGAILAAMITLMFPVDPEEHYTMGQIVGFMLVIGAVAGLAVGSILSLILARLAKRHRGSGVAIQADVRQ